MTHEAWVRLALDCGAKKATIVEKNQIVLSAAFRDICAQNGCGVYGRCWMCPPDVGDIHVLMDDLKTYTHGLWYQSIGEIEDSFDIEGMTAVPPVRKVRQGDRRTLPFPGKGPAFPGSLRRRCV